MWKKKERDLLGVDICWFADGSKTDDHLEAEVFRLRPRVEYSATLGKPATILQGEFCAIETCTKQMEKRHAQLTKIYADIQVAVKALESSRCNSNTVRNCR